MKSLKRIVSLVALALVLMFTAVCSGVGASVCQATDKKASAVYDAVSSAYGKSYPLSSSNEITTKVKNVFGGYSTVLGVSTEYIAEYKAAKKSNSKYEYVSFVCKANSSDDVSKIKNALKKYVKNEKSGNQNYFSSKGKKLINNSKIGASGKYVYLFILDTSKNSKAIKAFNKALK